MPIKLTPITSMRLYDSAMSVGAELTIGNDESCSYDRVTHYTLTPDQLEEFRRNAIRAYQARVDEYYVACDGETPVGQYVVDHHIGLG